VKVEVKGSQSKSSVTAEAKCKVEAK